MIPHPHYIYNLHWYVVNLIAPMGVMIVGGALTYIVQVWRDKQTLSAAKHPTL